MAWRELEFDANIWRAHFLGWMFDPRAPHEYAWLFVKGDQQRLGFLPYPLIETASEGELREALSAAEAVEMTIRQEVCGQCGRAVDLAFMAGPYEGAWNCPYPDCRSGPFPLAEKTGYLAANRS